MWIYFNVSILLAAAILVIIILVFLLHRLAIKVELYESTINDFYTKTAFILHAMRTLDERQMFEDDDDVGFVFKQLRDVLFTLHPLLYGTNDQQEDSEDS